MGKPKKSISHAFKLKHRKNKQTKSFLEFDDKARTEFLTGFKKRKDERRQKAQEKLKEQKLLEKKRIREKKRQLVDERIRRFEAAQQQMEDDGLNDIAPAQSYELPNHTVTVTDVTGVDYVGSSGLMLGSNKASEKDEEAEVGMEDNVEDEGSDENSKENSDLKGLKHFRQNGKVKKQWNPHRKQQNFWQLTHKQKRGPSRKEAHHKKKPKKLN